MRYFGSAPLVAALCSSHQILAVGATAHRQPFTKNLVSPPGLSFNPVFSPHVLSNRSAAGFRYVSHVAETESIFKDAGVGPGAAAGVPCFPNPKKCSKSSKKWAIFF